MVKRRFGKKPIIVQVRQSKKSKQKTVTIPKSARGVRKGDYLILRRLNK